MSVVYENELMNMKKDYLKAGHTESEWKDTLKDADFTLKNFGFHDAYEVRALADKYGRRV